METTLHRQLKELYADDPQQREVAVDGYRIDAVRGNELVEVQSASLSAIRDKIRVLLEDYRVLVVKPLAASKLLVKRKRKGGRVASSRRSPRRETVYDLFDELVHFVGVFPHPDLTLHVLLTEQEEHRLPRKKRRWRSKDYRVEDRLLLGVVEQHEFRTAADLLSLLPDTVPEAFTTADIAREADIPRWLAQKMAYCLRKTEAVHVVGKSGNAMLYGIEQVAAKKAA
jgi:hypothetical protein